MKVDADAVPAEVATALKAGKVDLDDPASTMVLLKANAVVGITGHFGSNGQLTSLGVHCAFCHSTVDDSFAPGIGHRLDGWANRDLKGSEIGIDDFQSDRSPDRSYRTAPLRGLTTHAKGGFYHDGRFPDLMAVVEHYSQFLKLGLSDAEKRDLVEYLKSL